MAVCTIASARAATVGAGGSLRIASSVSSFQTRTRLSPVAARAGWGRPTAATRPRIMMSTRPMTVVSLRICRHPSAVPTRPPATPKVASRVERSNPGGARTGNTVRGGSGSAVHPQEPVDQVGSLADLADFDRRCGLVSLVLALLVVLVLAAVDRGGRGWLGDCGGRRGGRGAVGP